MSRSKMKKRGSVLTAQEWNRFKFGWAFSRPDVVKTVTEQAKKIGRPSAELFEITARAWLLANYDVKPPPSKIEPNGENGKQPFDQTRNLRSP